MTRRHFGHGGGERTGTGPIRLITEPSGGAMELVHWSPAEALGWSCVQCRATFISTPEGWERI